ncbi:MAG TPA: GNAT family N-acetyltransferase [archaeon]|nr:GNAT family N-acetyltransferase [archaeon]
MPQSRARISVVKEIPEQMIEGFVQESGIWGHEREEWKKSIRSDGLKFGAYEGETLVGFATADFWKVDPANDKRYLSLDKKFWPKPENNLRFTSIFVLPEFRGKGIAQRLAYRVAAEGKKQNVNRVTLSRIQPRMMDVVYKLIDKERRKANPFMTINHDMGEEFDWGADFKFPKKHAKRLPNTQRKQMP